MTQRRELTRPFKKTDFANKHRLDKLTNVLANRSNVLLVCDDRTHKRLTWSAPGFSVGLGLGAIAVLRPELVKEALEAIALIVVQGEGGCLGELRPPIKCDEC